MRIKILIASVVRGSVWPAGSTVDVDERQAKELIGLKRAAEVKEGATWQMTGEPAPAAAEPKVDKEKKK